MLNERLDNLTNIGSKQNVIYIISCLLRGTKSLSSLQQLVSNQLGTRITETANIVLLLGAMEYLQIDSDLLTPSALFLSDYSNVPADQVADVFTKHLINYLLDEKVITLDCVEYDLTSNSNLLPANSFKYRHSAYRNLLISFNILGLREDSKYDIFGALVEFIYKPGFVQKLTQEKLKALLAAEEEMGAEGEEFVLKFEANRIGLPKAEDIKQISVIDASAGFDIISYNFPDSVEYDRFIEVKTYKGEPHFHWSRNEKDKAALLRDHYYLYLVDYSRIGQATYIPEMIQDPIARVFESSDWNKTVDSYLIEKNTPEELYLDNNDTDDE